MFKVIEGLAPDVMGIEAVGKVTHEDYRDVLIPSAEAKMGKGPIKMLYVLGKDFTRRSRTTARSGSSTGTTSARSPW
jgi:hypothetical protein